MANVLVYGSNPNGLFKPESLSYLVKSTGR